MDSANISSTLRIAAWGGLILSVIIGIVLGRSAAAVPVGWGETAGAGAFFTMLGLCLLFGFAACISSLWMAQILENQEEMKAYFSQINSQLQMSAGDTKNTGPAGNTPAPVISSQRTCTNCEKKFAGWHAKCPHCGSAS